MSAAPTVFKLSVQSVCQLQQRKIQVSFEITGCLISELLWQMIPYCSNAVFSSAMLVGFGVHSVSVLHLIRRTDIWRLKYQRGYF